MDGVTIVLIIAAIIVAGGILAYVMSRSGRRSSEAARAKAAEIREQAAEHDRRLREDEVSAAEARARSEMARVEAQKRELEADRLAAEADSRSSSAAAIRAERDEQLRLADQHDPDVRTDDADDTYAEGYDEEQADARVHDATGVREPALRASAHAVSRGRRCRVDEGRGPCAAEVREPEVHDRRA